MRDTLHGRVKNNTFCEFGENISVLLLRIPARPVGGRGEVPLHPAASGIAPENQ